MTPCSTGHVTSCSTGHMTSCSTGHMTSCSTGHVTPCSTGHMTSCCTGHMTPCSTGHLTSCSTGHMTPCSTGHMTSCCTGHMTSCCTGHMTPCMALCDAFPSGCSCAPRRPPGGNGCFLLEVFFLRGSAHFVNRTETTFQLHGIQRKETLSAALFNTRVEGRGGASTAGGGATAQHSFSTDNLHWAAAGAPGSGEESTTRTQ
ncbi:Epsin-1 [Liparis tanakae]|uniref:Epsin-1 n=1 Tax=Liparis tanakae TaxID=230148 RepID=A0A4Z2EHF9_9TELE|nr:Epsin-1 [Liparis tanakae]